MRYPKTSNKGRVQTDGTVLDEVDKCRDLMLLLFGVLKLAVFIITVLRLSAIKDEKLLVNLTVLLSLLGCRQTSSSER